MPPWQPADGCADYDGNFDLTPDERDTLLAWLDADAPEGDPDAAAPLPEDDGEDVFADALVLELPEAYTPTTEPDDYRCQIVSWPVDHPVYVTGVRVEPDQQQMVHHTIVFAAGASMEPMLRELDAADPGPGYTCFGSIAGGSTDGLDADTIAELLAGGLPEGTTGSRTLGAWVPGVPALPFPDGTGLLVQPGELIVVQMHYNTSSASPVADRSSVSLLLADEVEHPAVGMPLVDLGWVTGLPIADGPMTIPAGDDHVEHATTIDPNHLLFAMARQSLGADPDEELVIHRVGSHQHQLGTSARIGLQHAGGGETCLLDLPDWDFQWQGAYTFTEPLTLSADDSVTFGCTWDNSAENQPVIDGEVAEPQDVTWGEGTRDEMCLGNLYLTRR